MKTKTFIIKVLERISFILLLSTLLVLVRTKIKINFDSSMFTHRYFCFIDPVS